MFIIIILFLRISKGFLSKNRVKLTDDVGIMMTLSQNSVYLHTEIFCIWRVFEIRSIYSCSKHYIRLSRNCIHQKMILRTIEEIPQVCTMFCYYHNGMILLYSQRERLREKEKNTNTKESLAEGLLPRIQREGIRKRRTFQHLA